MKLFYAEWTFKPKGRKFGDYTEGYVIAPNRESVLDAISEFTNYEYELVLEPKEVDLNRPRVLIDKTNWNY